MSLTCVSCYFPVKNKHGDNYLNWFRHTLSINCPYVFFTDKNTIDLIKSFRKDLPTYYIECSIEEFYTYKYKDKMITHPLHCPSVEVNLIWLEKIFMMKKASELNPFNSDWFKWIDAGICVYRERDTIKKDFSYIEKLNCLPKDKFIFSESEIPYNELLYTKTNYWHYISGTYILHKNFINTYTDIYKTYLDKLIDKNNIWTEQVIYTHIYMDHKELYFKLCSGYGEISLYLFN
jgi:hypothetical protein